MSFAFAYFFFLNFTLVIMMFLLGFSTLVTSFGAIKMGIFKNKMKITQINHKTT